MNVKEKEKIDRVRKMQQTLEGEIEREIERVSDFECESERENWESEKDAANFRGRNRERQRSCS